MSRFTTFAVSDPRWETDHLRQVTVRSPSLGRRGDLTLFVPPDAPRGLPLVVLLHGVQGSHWEWTGRAGAHRTALEMITSGRIRPVVIAMPSDGLWGDGSGYLPHEGARYDRWITEDVVEAAHLAVDALTPTSPRFLAGLSMGGYGALRLASLHPDRFRGASGMSSITCFADLLTFVSESEADYAARNVARDVLEVMLANRERLPALRFDCGRDDPLVSANRALRDALAEAGVPHTYEEFAGGHTWDYWSTHLVETLVFFDGLLPLE